MRRLRDRLPCGESEGDDVSKIILDPDELSPALMRHACLAAIGYLTGGSILDKDGMIAVLREAVTTPGEPAVKRDWRIGLTVKARLRSDELYYERGTIVDVFPSGTAGIDDKNGVLSVKMDGGSTILAPAERFITA